MAKSVFVLAQECGADTRQPQRLSRTDPTYALARFTACKAAFLAAGFLAPTDTYMLWGYGATGKALHRALLKILKPVVKTPLGIAS